LVVASSLRRARRRGRATPPRRRPPPRSPWRDLPGPFSALRAAFAGGYHAADLKADVVAGVVVGIVALPLSMALAVACGVPPQHGLYTASSPAPCRAGRRLGGAGLRADRRFRRPAGADLGELRRRRPAAGHRHGGGAPVAMGLARFGRLLQFVPYPVTTGFTAGIAVVIATLQVKDFLGLSVPALPSTSAAAWRRSPRRCRQRAGRTSPWACSPWGSSSSGRG
jgi:sulfate permease, SulP family